VGVIHPGLWTPVADIQFRHRRTWFASDAGEGPFIEWIADADEMEPQRGGAPIPGEVPRDDEGVAEAVRRLAALGLTGERNQSQRRHVRMHRNSFPCRTKAAVACCER
jgi:hypothetical protein